jgi:hypothetical protein
MEIPINDFLIAKTGKMTSSRNNVVGDRQGYEMVFDDNLGAAINWIKQAYAATGNQGISKGFNPIFNRWYPAYPETTGYLIPTLLNAANLNNQSELNKIALDLAIYLLKCNTSEGGIAHWKDHSKSYPIVFDTGQVIFGWLAAYKFSKDKVYLQAAVRAGDWLVSIQDASGSWRQNQHLGVEKVIDARVAWALLKLYNYTDKIDYLQAASRNLYWAMQQQDTDGWFKQCAFSIGSDPFTHTIAYTAEGLLESGILLNEANFISAARLTADALLNHQRPDGWIASTFGPNWRPSSSSCCLTGNCQISRLWLRLYEINCNDKYLEAAKRAIIFVTNKQNIKTTNENIRGAIAGSSPIYGKYERFKYPNWVAKFYIDALLMIQKVTDHSTTIYYDG